MKPQPAARTIPTARPQHLLIVDEAAAYLNVPRCWVAVARRQQRIRSSRIGKLVQFGVEHFDELIATGEQPVTATHGVGIVPLQAKTLARSRL